MKSRTRKFALAALLALLSLPVANTLRAYSYGPACQWMRLVGSVKTPPELKRLPLLYLTIQYRREGEKNFKTLLTRRLLREKDFAFVLSGFEEERNGVVFLPTILPFDGTFEFAYWVQVADRRWKSEPRSVFYRPRRRQKEGEHLCHTRLELLGLKLERP